MGWKFLPHTEVNRRRNVKDARINRQAKVRACTGGEAAAKINGAVVDVEASLTTPDRNGQTLTEGSGIA